MKSNLAVRALKKMLRIVGIDTQKHVTVKSAKWMREQALPYESKCKRKSEIEIVSEIETRTSLPNVTRAIECALNQIEEESDYKFGDMLVIKNPYQYAPLCALAMFHTKLPRKVKVTVKGKTSDCDIAYRLPAATKHRVPIMGLYPDCVNTVRIDLYSFFGWRIGQHEFRLRIASLKGRNSVVKVTKDISKEKYLYDLTLIYGGDDQVYPYAFDRNGDMRFAFRMIPKTYGFQPISGGRFLFLDKSITRQTSTNPAAIRLFEVDQMGRFHKAYHFEKGVHHDFAEIEDGNIVMASSAMDGVSYKTFEDTVIEVDRKSGSVVNEIKLKEYLDEKYVDVPDWAHLNSVEYQKEEKTVLICLRNLHAVMKVNYEKKEVLWILAHPSFWSDSCVADKVLRPLGDMEWFFQAHAAYLLDVDLDGNPDTKHLIIYDNHTQKRRPVDYFDKDKRSFVRIYSINEKERTVSLLKSYPFRKSSIRSNAVLEYKAGRVFAMNGKLYPEDEQEKSSVIEFDYESGEILNKYSTSYGFYRAYGFHFEPEIMSSGKAEGCDYFLGEIYGLLECESIDVSEAKKLPSPVLESEFQTEEERKNGESFL